MIQTLIIDDEPLAASIVEEYLKAFPQFEFLEICHDGFQGIKAIQKYKPDLIFLDVQMPKITGFEMLELLDEPPAVIFTTAFDQFALKAFDSMAIDYLLKPFSQERFNQAIERFLNQSSSIDQNAINQLAEKTNRLVVRVKNEIKIIPIKDVTFFEAEDDYIAIHCKDGKYLKKMTMKSLEEALDPSKFARVHRSYLVNLNEVTQIEPYERENFLVKLRNGEQVPVSKSGYSRLRQVLGL
ncbi:LytTR family DNA-binding domain-containing protein [Algoriphagus sp.]|uniref:LytR/AlgR family response regulator transcription factor n=1 Tax=Algoriphagus sp. TaxID=1872435 RepID=UPI0025FB7498|nr:LytTR family DNA-binding domain-containing protein [Algoriphagus sp.]